MEERVVWSRSAWTFSIRTSVASPCVHKRGHVCSLTRVQSHTEREKRDFQGFSADCRAAGRGRREDKNEGKKDGSEVRESVAFKVWNSPVWAGLQGGCVCQPEEVIG